jgi:4-hydroxy-tetrahydrodipicolinate reductase
MGRLTAAAGARRSGLRLVGAVDVDPDLDGRSLAELVGEEAVAAVSVRGNLQEALGSAAAVPQVAVHCTGSRLAVVAPQLEELLSAGMHVVSTCEELSYPWRRQPALAQRLDSHARKSDRTLLATGVNPGLVMDSLVLALASPCVEVHSVSVWRRQDAAQRRGPLQRKVGAGLSEDEFRALAARGGIGHVGLGESADLLASGLGWELERYEESIEPVLADLPYRTPFVEVTAGQALGQRQTGRGWRSQDREPSLRLTVEMYLGAAQPSDRIEIEGDPPVRVEIEGGIHGDRATVGMLLNAVPWLGRLRSGLRTMRDLPPIGGGSPSG